MREATKKQRQRYLKNVQKQSFSDTKWRPRKAAGKVSKVHTVETKYDRKKLRELVYD